jgi:hypothetical protein
VTDRIVFTGTLDLAGTLERLLTDALDSTGVYLPPLARRRVVAPMADLADSSVVVVRLELHRPGPQAEQ